MTYLRIISDFHRLSDGNLYALASFVRHKMTENAYLFPNPLPTMAAFGLASEDFRLDCSQAATGDRIMISEKKLSRNRLIKLMYRLSYYVLFMADGDRTIAMQSGFTLSKDDHEKQDLSVPNTPVLEHGNQTGQLLARTGKVKGARAYAFQYTTDKELKDESWQSQSSSSCKCLLKGLQPGLKYYVRVGAVGARDQVLFSPTISSYVA